MDQRSDRPVHHEYDAGSEVLADDATPLCLNCLAEITCQTAFCPKCNAPVGPFATWDPMQQIRSMGWMYRRASGSGASGISTVGLWLLIGPGLLLTTGGLFMNGFPRADFTRALQALPLLALEIMLAIILFRGTRTFLRQRKQRLNERAEFGHVASSEETNRTSE